MKLKGVDPAVALPPEGMLVVLGLIDGCLCVATRVVHQDTWVTPLPPPYDVWECPLEISPKIEEILWWAEMPDIELPNALPEHVIAGMSTEFYKKKYRKALLYLSNP